MKTILFLTLSLIPIAANATDLNDVRSDVAGIEGIAGLGAATVFSFQSSYGADNLAGEWKRIFPEKYKAIEDTQYAINGAQADAKRASEEFLNKKAGLAKDLAYEEQNLAEVERLYEQDHISPEEYKTLQLQRREALLAVEQAKENLANINKGAAGTSAEAPLKATLKQQEKDLAQAKALYLKTATTDTALFAQKAEIKALKRGILLRRVGAAAGVIAALDFMRRGLNTESEQDPAVIHGSAFETKKPIAAHRFPDATEDPAVNETAQ